MILKNIKVYNILVIPTPIWFGLPSSVAKIVFEKLDGTHIMGDPETGQYLLYGKASRVTVTGNCNGTYDICSTILFSLIHRDCAVPPNADCY